MKNRYSWLLSVLFFTLLTSCLKDGEDVLPESILSEYQLQIISYFKEVALGSEFGYSSEVTRKWQSSMKMFIGGNPSPILMDKVNQTIEDINGLVSDGFRIRIVNDSSQSNCYIFFGSASDFIKKFPDVNAGLLDSGTGLAEYWNSNDIINRARIFIDTNRPHWTQQQSIVLEEITQSLGLGRDSPRYPTSIFFETTVNGGYATEYAPIDEELIRLLYHPNMSVGLNKDQVDEVLRKILTSE